VRISTPEFVAIMAMLVATVALSMDGLLPALSMIADDMTPDDPNRAQFVLSSFVVGMAVGTFFMGPISDSFGRKRVIHCGAVLYIFCALICATTDNFDVLLLARLGQAALAPLMGSFVMLAFTWQAIFGLFILFVAISTFWMSMRIGESVPVNMRIPFRLSTISAAVEEVLGHSVIVTSIIGLIFAYCILFVAIFLVQPVFDQVYDRSASFPYWFALVAILSAVSSFLNAQLVRRFGMRALINVAFQVQVVLSCVMLMLWYADMMRDTVGFVIFVTWIFSLFFMAGMTIGNLTALAMEPVGHIAGTAASVISGLATIGSVIFAAILGQFFDGTLFVMIFGVAVFAVLGAIVVHRLKRFERPNNA